jgi:nitrate/nitrite transport system substrate-binding protein
MLTQLKRWGYLKEDVDYKKVAEKVFLATEARTRLAALGIPVPASTYQRHTIMGKEFDPTKPEAYLASFPIRRV